jgi:hypothetical protein
MSREFITKIHVLEDELSIMLSELPDNDPNAASDFFARFGFWQLYYSNRFYETLDRGHEILPLCARLNPEVYKKIHKGYPLYWMGMAAYRIHDFQSAIYYIDATLSEDLKNIPTNPDTPPRLFLRLEGEDDRQAAKDIVQGAQETVEEYINLYNQILKESKLKTPLLNIDDVRSGLLRPAVSSDNPDIRSLASTFITFLLEFKYRDFQLNLRTEPGTNEPFFIHLFKGCLLFESLLKNNPTKKIQGTTLSPVLRELRKELDLPKDFSLGNVQLPQVLDEILNVDDRISTAILTTGRLRNTIGHNMGWSTQLLPEQYTHSFLLIGISCLHTIATLYRSNE